MKHEILWQFNGGYLELDQDLDLSINAEPERMTSLHLLRIRSQA